MTESNSKQRIDNLKIIKQHCSKEEYKEFSLAKEASNLVMGEVAGTFSIKQDDGKVVALQSLRTPQKAAERSINRWLEKKNARDNDIFIVVDAIPYFNLKCIADFMNSNATLILVVSDPSLLKAVANSADLSFLGDIHNLHIVIQEDPIEAWCGIHKVIFASSPNRIHIFEQKSLTRALAGYQRYYLTIEKNLLKYEYNWVTSAVGIQSWLKHTVQNIPQLFHESSLRLTKNMFAGKPALIIAAGPSLDDGLQKIKDAQDKAVIIVIGRALKAVLAAGIHPDFCVVVDGHETMWQQFDGIDPDELRTTYLIASSSVLPQILKLFKGRIFPFGLNCGEINNILAVHDFEYVTIRSAGTVTINAADSACFMGCNPIYTFGFDLCEKSDGASYAKDANVYAEPPKATLMVAGNWQKEVGTIPQFARYLVWAHDYFAKIAEEHGVKAYNVNDGGALIKNMTAMHLADFNSESWQILDDKQQVAIAAYQKIFMKNNSAGKVWFADVKEEIDEFLEITNEGALLAAELSASSPNDDNANSQNRLHGLEQKIMLERKVNVLLEALMQSGELDHPILEAETKAEKIAETYAHTARLFFQLNTNTQWLKILIENVLADNNG